MSPYDSQILRLCQKAQCTTPEAEQALAQSQGSLLSALLYLENQGKIPCPNHPNQGFFSSKDLSLQPTTTQGGTMEKPVSGGIWKSLHRELIANYFELWKEEEYLTRMPVLVLLFLFPLTLGSLLLVLVLPLLFGLHYRFSQEQSFLAEFNPIMKRVSLTLSELGMKIKGDNATKKR